MSVMDGLVYTSLVRLALYIYASNLNVDFSINALKFFFIPSVPKKNKKQFNIYYPGIAT